MYEKIDKDWFMRKYIPEYEEIESTWETYKDILVKLDNIYDIPEYYSDVKDWISSKMTYQIIDIIGYEVFGDTYDYVINCVNHDLLDGNWNACSLKGNAIDADIDAMIQFIKDVASDNDITTLEELDWNYPEIICALNSDSYFKFV